jgi:hypothetical protein
VKKSFVPRPLSVAPRPGAASARKGPGTTDHGPTELTPLDRDALRRLHGIFDTLKSRGELSFEALAEWHADLTSGQIRAALKVLRDQGRVIAKHPCPDSRGRTVTFTAVCRHMLDAHLIHPSEAMVQALAAQLDVRRAEVGDDSSDTHP